MTETETETESGEARTTTAATRISPDQADRLRWLAYRRRTTTSFIIASYVTEGLEREDFTGYSPPD